MTKTTKSAQSTKAVSTENQVLVGEGRDFERIRRITGYLVGTMDHWNSAKAAEEKDRVKHDVSTGFEKI